MLKIDFNGDQADNHICIGHQEKDWIIFSCPECKYKRKINWKTGEMRTRPGDERFTHSGQHSPLQAQHFQEHLN